MGGCRDYSSTPKRLKVTCSTARIWVGFREGLGFRDTGDRGRGGGANDDDDDDDDDHDDLHHHDEHDDEHDS